MKINLAILKVTLVMLLITSCRSHNKNYRKTIDLTTIMNSGQKYDGDMIITYGYLAEGDTKLGMHELLSTVEFFQTRQNHYHFVGINSANVDPNCFGGFVSVVGKLTVNRGKTFDLKPESIQYNGEVKNLLDNEVSFPQSHSKSLVYQCIVSSTSE